jgi:collagenase-like protein with putative collagen-binding domain/uncharacterized protein DUF4038
MDEGAYEAGSEYGYPVTPLLVRRQAWYSYLAGGFHTYGHNDLWRVLPTWRQAIEAPGASQAGKVRSVLKSLPEWWLLTPDQSVLASGGNTDGDVLFLSARHKDGNWAIVYCAAPHTFSVTMNKLTGAVQASWVDPRRGERKAIGSVRNSGIRSFTTPDGWEDAVLLLVRPKGKAK